MYECDERDARLRRLLLAVTLLVEALEGLSSRFEWGVWGCSGNTPEQPFVRWADAESGLDRAARLRLVRRLASAAQYSRAGDSLVAAARVAVAKVVSVSATGHIVLVLAGLGFAARGDDDARALGAQLVANPSVAAYTVLLAHAASCHALEKPATSKALVTDVLPPGRALIAAADADIAPALEIILRTPPLRKIN